MRLLENLSILLSSQKCISSHLKKAREVTVKEKTNSDIVKVDMATTMVMADSANALKGCKTSA